MFNIFIEQGQDDLRQDAVMQQVFGVMNKLLQADAKTKSRRLQVRTYKVVPLSQRTGILEWCENTQTFGDYLVNPENGAHQKYRPNDYQPMECRRKMLVSLELRVIISNSFGCS
jgi:ataxia telangiectasia mutated family protein